MALAARIANVTILSSLAGALISALLQVLRGI
jgi:hypothetical protein